MRALLSRWWMIDITAGFWSSWCLLLIGWLIPIVVFLFATSSSDRAKQHPAGLEEGNQKGLFGLRPAPADKASRLHAQASSWKIYKPIKKGSKVGCFISSSPLSNVILKQSIVLWWIYSPFLLVNSRNLQKPLIKQGCFWTVTEILCDLI